MREDLLGYLLGALSPDEHRRVERLLEANPPLRQTLEQLQEQLGVLQESRLDYEPPPGLAERTCELVETCRSGQRSVGLNPARDAAGRDRLVRRDRWSMADSVVATGIVAVACMLFFPMIHQSRMEARRLACQDNLRRLGAALASYSQQRADQRLPYVPPRGKQAFAGVFAPTLRAHDLLEDCDLLICPESRLAQRREGWRMVTLTDLEQASGRTLLRLQQMAGGSYAYTLGFMDGERHAAPRREGRAYFVVMGDAPTEAQPRGGVGHGKSQNLLFDDGHVRAVAGTIEAPHLDDPYRNLQGRIEAGTHRDDAVIAESGTPPFQFRPLPVAYPSAK